jgi:DNA-binding NarL/FixJ family response regulator
MIELKFNRLSDKQLRVWRLRYRHGWKMKRIALELGISRSGVCKMIGRIHGRLGLPKRRISVMRPKLRPGWMPRRSAGFRY